MERDTGPAAAELLRQFCVRHRCTGMSGPALALRDALAATIEDGPAPAAVQVIRLRDWAAILTATADAMERGSGKAP